MAKKNRKAKKPPKQWVLNESPIPDRRVLEQVLRQVGGEGFGDAKAETPEDRALDLVHAAFETAGPEQVRLAKEALKTWPDCADAYVLLAENSRSVDAAIDHYQQGVAAGERALGKKAFKEFDGHFWGFVETRPYMRARGGLAHCLWEAGRRDEAAEHFRAMLRLNPNDNQGNRWSLATLLLELDRDAELASLLEKYPDEASCAWAYSRALLAFRQEGETARAKQLLKQAAKSNKHVSGYLLGHTPPPVESPPYVMVGEKDEAGEFSKSNRLVWLNTPGAISWLRKTLPTPLPKPTKRRQLAWPQRRMMLLGLPQAQGEVWQIDAIPSSAAGPEDPVEEIPWMIVVLNPDSHEMIAADVVGDAPAPSAVWEFLHAAMRKPEDGDARRPAAIEVCQPAFAKAWRAKLKQIEVECVLVDELGDVASFRGLMHESASRENLPAGAGDLQELPLEPGEVWQADIRPLPSWIMGEGAPYRPWVGLVVNRTEGLVLAHNICEERPPAEWLGELIAQAGRQPVMGEAHRPGIIEVATAEQRDALLLRLESAGIECRAVDQLEFLDAAMKSMEDHLGPERGSPSLLDAPGIKPAQLAALYAAAAEFYRRRPWQRVRGDTLIKVECDKFQSGPWYAVVMGQSGMELGVALYEDLAALQKLLSGELAEAESARAMSALSLMYCEAFGISPAELDAVEKHGWSVAGPEAYPTVIRVSPGLAVRTPLVWELELLEGCLRAIPGFVEGKADMLSVPADVASGTLALRLSWVPDA